MYGHAMIITIKS